jgi:hypothetical protein
LHATGVLAFESLVNRIDCVEVVHGRPVGTSTRDVGAHVPVGDLGVVTVPSGLQLGDERADRTMRFLGVRRRRDDRPL